VLKHLKFIYANIGLKNRLINKNNFFLLFINCTQQNECYYYIFKTIKIKLISRQKIFNPERRRQNQIQ